MVYKFSMDRFDPILWHTKESRAPKRTAFAPLKSAPIYMYEDEDVAYWVHVALLQPELGDVRAICAKDTAYWMRLDERLTAEILEPLRAQRSERRNSRLISTDVLLDGDVILNVRVASVLDDNVIISWVAPPTWTWTDGPCKTAFSVTLNAGAAIRSVVGICGPQMGQVYEPECMEAAGSFIRGLRRCGGCVTHLGKSCDSVTPEGAVETCGECGRATADYIERRAAEKCYCVDCWAPLRKRMAVRICSISKACLASPRTELGRRRLLCAYTQAADEE